ncbi:MAG: class I SAM-dependent DNA methyltransferase, partial [Mesorhizobium sp.]
LFLRDVQARVQNVLRMADYLAPKYHVVVANPPYMGGKGMNPRLGDFAKATYPDSKSDLYAMFIERGILLTVEFGYASMVSMHAWMFLSSFEKLRRYIFGDATVVSMAHLGARAFDSIGGEVVATTAFTLKNTSSKMKGVYLRLIGGQNEKE